MPASRAAAAFDAAPLAMLITDSHDRVVQANIAAERLLGRARGGLLGESLESLLPGGSEAFASQSPSAADAGRAGQAYVQVADGQFLPVEVTIESIACGDGPAVLYSLASRGEMRGLEDELARLAERLRAQNQELGRRNEELDEFTYVASHDLQEPLRKLIAFSELLSVDAGSELPEKAAGDLRHIVAAASRMRQLIDDLLELSRTGRSDLRLQPVPLDACVDAALERLATRVEESGARIAREPLPTVRGDPTLLTQLYQNLLGNALKFVAAGTRPDVRLTARREAEHGRWVLGVIDNGIGLKPEYAERIFAPFKRLHTRAEYPGSGVGLAICRKAVERHGGRIWVESSPGRGAHFQFTLPEGGVP
ncbi:MAG: PAS domain S-box protein [Phycisphaerae bacterium]|nr:PAS domain S-box protein [Phycisphaerae bacterium]MCZ2399050.1 PAS domain S-box protein [Phycisphaerae bacterium]